MRYVLLELINCGWSSSNTVIEETLAENLEDAVNFFKQSNPRLYLDERGYYKPNTDISYCVAEVFGS